MPGVVWRGSKKGVGYFVGRVYLYSYEYILICIQMNTFVYLYSNEYIYGKRMVKEVCAVL